MADTETEERLLPSLNRFFGCLAFSGDLKITDWMRSVLTKPFYVPATSPCRVTRMNAPGKLGFADWCTELDEDLDSRCLLLPSSLGGGISWSETKGWREATLYDEANALWQSERMDLLAGGMHFEQMRDALVLSFQDWADSTRSAE